MKLIKNVQLVLTDRVISNGTIIFDNKIRKINKIDAKNYDDEYEIIDGEGAYLTPGFIDIHIHGAGGHDTMEGNPEALEKISKTIIKSGVSHFLPTTMTMEKKYIKSALYNIVECMKNNQKGAEILGVNVEGPFINSEYKGAQAEANILKPDIKLIKDYLEYIKIITIAPEIKGSKEFIEEMTKNGIVSSVGHSGASYEDVRNACKWGLSHSTHLFNAMTGLHHRKPGIVGAVLTDENMTCELIADLIHVNPDVLKLVTMAKDPSKIILITDSMEAGGLGDGEYSLGGQKVIVNNNAARLENGALAGSILTLNKAVINMINSTNLPLVKIINMVTLNPASLLNLNHKMGIIKEGYDANLSLFNNNFEVKKVFVQGEERYNLNN